VGFDLVAQDEIGAGIAGADGGELVAEGPALIRLVRSAWFGWPVVVARPCDKDAFEESAFLIVWYLWRDWSPQRQKQAGCGEGVPVFFLVDGGALS
jgi:hypothetical protein